MKHKLLNPCRATLVLLLAHWNLSAADLDFLWQIGRADRNNAEFALAPAGYGQFKTDALFVIGESDPKQDWPYVHPGPGDVWAGGREHTFSILFGLKTTPATGECQLSFDLLDTHSQSPPKLRIKVNGQSFDRTLPPGGGDESADGQLSKAKQHTFTLPLPASLLRLGDNEIHITTLTGSWLLYDSVGMKTPPGAELEKIQARTLVDRIQPVRALQEKEGKSFQPILVTLRHFGDEADAVVRVEGAKTVPVHLKHGSVTVEVSVPAVAAETKLPIAIEVGGQTLAAQSVIMKPVRRMTVYILPHSHTDIGYTEIQTAIEKKQVQNLVDGMAAAKRTASYPEGARFVWNVEVLWAADLYLHRMNDAQRADFLAAVKNGQVVLNGMYLNELTGLCRPEELLRLFRFSTQMAGQTGVPVDSVMISDVPGYTWGTVTAMNQAGIRYFSTAPNYFDRIGTILREWENKPFWWVGPDGKSKVLVWIPFWGYAMSHRYGRMSPELVDAFCDGLEQRAYPYDIAYARWSGHGDNAIPDPSICDFVKDWNSKYAWPRFIISGTSEAFRALEQRYGDKLPVVRGDWTPYWEDGAGSSALETAMNRASSDRLAQAETVFAMLKPAAYPANRFADAWNNVLLYSEHTWGADCSVSLPEHQKTREQWEIKKSYADEADKKSRGMLEQALADGTTSPPAGAAGAKPGPLEVINTLSWPRTELVVLSREQSAAGDRMVDDEGKPVPSQRLSTGELVFLAKAVPPFAVRRFTLSAGEPHVEARAVAGPTTLDSGVIQLRVDEKTGGITQLSMTGIKANFADTSGGESLNDYRYFIGDDPAAAQRNGQVKISAGESGPLVASLILESAAPGCERLRRELRVVAGGDYVEINNLVIKTRLAAASYKKPPGKESLNFAFPFNVPDGQMLLDIPLGTMRPELDQMPSACKNWFTVGRWADVSNPDYGVTWVTLDAPLVQVGGLTANLLESQTNPDVWRKKVDRTQKLYSWAMNNHWGTNYRAYQDGPTVFRFILRPHRRLDRAEATRFATGFSQPLLARPATGNKSPATPLLRVEPAGVITVALKPSDDGKALIVRLFGASGKAESAKLSWAVTPKQIWLSDTSEQPLKRAADKIDVPAWGVLTLRAELP